jgi:hypothetical protein
MTGSPLFLVFQISQKLIATDAGFASDCVDVVRSRPTALNPAVDLLRCGTNAPGQLGLVVVTNLYGAMDSLHARHLSMMFSR